MDVISGCPVCSFRVVALYCRDVDGLWKSFQDVLSGSGGEDAKSSLVDKLKETTKVIQNTRGPFVGADYVSRTDLALAPRLRHTLVALPAIAVSLWTSCLGVMSAINGGFCMPWSAVEMRSKTILGHWYFTMEQWGLKGDN